MINIRQDLIEEELYFPDTEESSELMRGLKFKPLKPSNKFIQRLFNNYYVEEFTEHYYDASPSRCITDDVEEYEEERLRFCTWIEVYGKGIWKASQRWVDNTAKQNLVWTKRNGQSYNGRLFWVQRDEFILIYYYGRDFNEMDFWWVLKKRKRSLR